jgi:hypothetical protein
MSKQKLNVSIIEILTAVLVVVVMIIQSFWYMDAVRHSKSLQSQEHLNLQESEPSVFEEVLVNELILKK